MKKRGKGIGRHGMMDGCCDGVRHVLTGVWVRGERMNGGYMPGGGK